MPCSHFFRQSQAIQAKATPASSDPELKPSELNDMEKAGSRVEHLKFREVLNPKP